MAQAKWAIDWWESEKGWGQKPLGSRSLYESRQDALKAIKEHWAGYPDGPTPDYYIFPSNNSPFLVEVDE